MSDWEHLRLQLLQAAPALVPAFDNLHANELAASSALTRQIQRMQQLEALLYEQEQRLRLALEASEQGLWDWNPQTGERYCDPNWWRMLGYEPGEFDASGNFWREQVVYPADLLSVDRAVAWRLQGERVTHEYRARCKDGRLIWIRAGGYVVEWDTEDRPIRMIGTNINVTDLKEKERLLDESRGMAEAANYSKSEFLANMSHEIRTPINIILGYSQLLSQEVGDARQQNFIRSIVSSSQTLLHLLNDLLDLAKIEAGKLHIRTAPFDVLDLLEEQRCLFADEAELKGLALRIDIPAAVPRQLMLDGARLRQILMNLLGNAIKFTHRGEVILRLTAQLQAPGIYTLAIDVQDTGPGIPAPELQSIFIAFYQQSANQSSGAGLGLSVSQRLAHMMGGMLRVQSAVGSGSTFTLTLVEVPVADELLPDPQPNARVIADGDLPWIVIADDYLPNCNLLVDALDGLPVRCAIAGNGQEALFKARQLQPQLVFMDLKMPVLNGREAARILRQDPHTHHVPLVAMTASPMADSLTGEELAYFDDTLQKPLHLHDLRRIVQRFLPGLFPQAELPALPLPLAGLLVSDVGAWGERPLPPEERPYLHALLQVMGYECMPHWQRVQTSLLLDEVLVFADGLCHLASQYHSSVLLRYAERLRQTLEQVDIKHMRLLLAQFPRLVQALQQWEKLSLEESY